MANRIEGVHEKVLKCAEAEFLEKGFKDASLRVIAQNADTSTGSIYTRFSDKEGLFAAVVEPVFTEFTDWYIKVHITFHKLPKAKQKENMHVRINNSNDNEFLEFIVDYVYKNFDIFRILLIGADGTRFSDFINSLVEIEDEYTIKLIEDINSTALSEKRVTPQILHILASAYLSGIFEMVLHNMDKEDAIVYAKQLTRFFSVGWRDVFRFHE